MDFEVVAEGLQFPEGPIAMQDGSVIFVEIARGTLTRAWNGRTEVVAQLGGGPNGAAVGPDGAVYVCNNGGFEWRQWNGLLVPAGTAKDYSTGRIERVNLATGSFERVYDSVNGNRLSGPNDIVFDKQGNLWFTDLGKHFPRHRDISGLYYARPDGSSITEVSYNHLSLNGVGLSPDEKTVYCNETDTGRLWAFDLASPGALDPARHGRGRIVVHAARTAAARQSRRRGQRTDLLRHDLQRRHHDLLADRRVRARRLPGRAHHEHLLRRSRHARRVHHAVGDRQAGEGALAAAGAHIELQRVTRIDEHAGGGSDTATSPESVIDNRVIE